MGSSPSRSTATVQPEETCKADGTKQTDSTVQQMERIHHLESEVQQLKKQLADSQSQVAASNEHREQLMSRIVELETQLVQRDEKEQQIQKQKHQQRNQEMTQQTVSTSPTHGGQMGDTLNRRGTAVVPFQPRPAPTLISRSVSDCAVSLAWLQVFARDIDPTWSTADVVFKFIVPQTEQTKRRYTDQLPSNDCSTPTFFISHRWSDGFRELVETLTAYCQTSGLGDPAHVFLWLDIFAVNQHTGAAQAQDLSNLDKAIMASKKGTLLVMDERGGVLTRIWCLFEIHQTVRRRERKEADLIMLLPKNVDAAMMGDVWTALDVEKAEATVMADRDRILEEIRASEVDTQALNMKLKSTLVLGSQLQMDAARETFLASLMRTAQMLRLSGHTRECLPLLEEAISMREKLPDRERRDHQLSLADCQNELAAVLCDGLYKYDEAMPWCESGLSIRRSLLGPDHLDIAASLDRLGWILLRLDRFEEVEQRFGEALEMRRRLVHGDSALVATSLGNYARALDQLKMYDGALKFQDLSTSMFLRVVGKDHPSYAASLGSKARLLLEMQRPEEALKLATEALNTRIRIQGVDHPDTGVAHFRASSILEKLERYQEAYEHRLKYLERSRLTLGANHREIANLESGLSSLLERLGRYDESIKRISEAKRIYSHLGDDASAEDCRKMRLRIQAAGGS